MLFILLIQFFLMSSLVPSEECVKNTLWVYYLFLFIVKYINLKARKENRNVI